MKAWEHVINTAMLGTDKPVPADRDLPEDIALVTARIDAAEALDKESAFLHKAAVIYNYRQCGFKPLAKPELVLNKAEAELKPACSAIAANVLYAIIDEDNAPLLELWMKLCSRAGQLFQPDVMPTVLDKAQRDQSLRPLVINCSGNRGAWLSKLNPAWNYFSTQPDEELWQTGNPDERLKVLKRVRQDDPDKAREWMQQTWPQEGAAGKAELIKVLKINSGPADLPWLEVLLTEKGQKVREEVLALLKLIPGSSIISQYEDLLRQSVILKREKGLLGMMTKTSIQLKLPGTVNEAIFKSGIEKLAGQKSKATDEEHIIHQLIASVPPKFWEGQFAAPPAQVYDYFEKYAPAMLSSLAMAVTKFQQKDWLPFFLKSENFYHEFINLLPIAEQDKYLLRFIGNDPQQVIQHALLSNQEWGLSLAMAAIRHMAGNPYNYNRGFFNQHISLIPAGVISQLEKIDAKEANLQPAWEKNRAHLLKLLTLKQQALQAFNA